MQASLSGNAKIVILCTISPTIRCQDETTNTLKFAARAKKIRMEAHVNETMDDKTLLKVYRLEIEQLKTKLQTLESQSKMLNNNPNNVYNENGSGGGGLSDGKYTFINKSLNKLQLTIVIFVLFYINRYVRLRCER